jgi:hypothetical protein
VKTGKSADHQGASSRASQFLSEDRGRLLDGSQEVVDPFRLSLSVITHPASIRAESTFASCQRLPASHTRLPHRGRRSGF